MIHKATSYCIFKTLNVVNSLDQEVIAPHAHYRTSLAYLQFTLKYFDIHFTCSQQVNNTVFFFICDYVHDK